MSIKFCPKCKGMMIPDKNEDKLVWVCRSCGKVQRGKKDQELVLSKEMNDKKGIPVVDLDKETDKLSVIDADCWKCGNDKAMWWLQQTRSGDEAATRFYKCVKCNHIWRENS